MRRSPRLQIAAVAAATAVLLLTAGMAQAALPNQSPDDTAMVDGTGQVRVRAITETAGGRTWVGGQFSEVNSSTGAFIRSVDNLVAFTPGGTLDTSVNIPAVTRSGGGAVVFDMSLAPSGTLYIAGDFDSVGGLPRNNVAAIDPNTGNVTSFHPGGAAGANAIYATSSAIYVGTGKLLSYQPNGSPTPGYVAPIAIVDAGLRGHPIAPQFRDITAVGNTLVVACQCDQITDSGGTEDTKALVQVNASSGNLLNWTPANFNASSAAFGISVIVHASTIYLAAGGSDFTGAYSFSSGANPWKTDTSGSSQAVAWYQDELLIGGHFDWSERFNGPSSCGDNDTPNTGCHHSPKLISMDPSNGHVNLVGPGPWNPGVCCKYNGVWAITPGANGSTLHIGGEFTKVGGTWSGSGTTWALSNDASTQRYYARLNGPPTATQTLTLQKSGIGLGTVTSTPSGISCNATCQGTSADFTTGATVTLSATASAGFTFTGWGGDCTNTTGNCLVAMSTARLVTATFDPISFPLTVTKTGQGTGTVTSDPAGIDCGAVCSDYFGENTVVTLTATPGANSAFNGWSGSGCTGTGTCVVTMDAAKNVTADFRSTTLTLNVIRGTGPPEHPGQGTITSSPTGINCPADCSQAYSVASVTLTASAPAGSVFNGWSGGGCSGYAAACVVTMDASKTVTGDFIKARNINLTFGGSGGGTVASDPPAAMSCSATCPTNKVAEGSTVTLRATPDVNSVFTGWSGTNAGACLGTTAPCALIMTGGKVITATFQPGQRLTVIPAGSGEGIVTSDPAGIDCGLTCSANYLPDTNVILQADPDANSTFTGWSGEGCSGTGTCSVTMSQARNVTAIFTLVQRELTVHVTGQGTVTDSPGPINCPGTCTGSYEHGTDVSLQATPAVNWSFSGWSGDCTGTDVCVVSMAGARDVTALFERINRTVTVGKAGTGTGTVTSNPAGIDCGADCVEGFNQGDEVTLTADADPGSIFTGWSGDCTGTGACVLTIDAARNVTATFELLHNLSVATLGAMGTVTSDVGGISCPLDCSTDLAHGTQVELTATPASGFSFAGWGGDCAGTATTCNVTMDSDKAVTAAFSAAQELTVSLDGDGTGIVTSPPNNEIDCPSTCSHDFAQGASVTLHAEADAGSVFTGWSSPQIGFPCTGTGDCVVTMNMPRNVTASFEPTQPLHVMRSGAGGGTVTSTPAGISCGVACDHAFQEGASVTLHAAGGPNSSFTGWSGDVGAGCPGTGDCTVTMDQERFVTAHFASIQHQLSVTKDGTGTGNVTSLAPNTGIDCGATCASDFQQGASVVLHAAPDATSTFTGWSGGGCSGTADCTVTMDAAKSVNATFNLAQRLLSVTKSGSGTGTVTSTPAGISCGATCTASFAHGAVVSLTPAPDATMVFAGWSGACSGTGACNVTMDAAKSVNAVFNPPSSEVTLPDSAPAIAYNAWRGTSNGAASGGFYRESNVKNDKVTWKSPITTSLTWVTRTGPDQGKASVTIDTVAQGTVDLYSASPGTLNKLYAGLTSKAHTVVIKVLGTKNAASTGLWVRLDAFVVGATTTQESDPAIQYNTWKSIAKTNATDGTYREASANTATVSVTFTGTSIEWITTKGKAYGKATVTIDGVAKGTVDLYQAATAWQTHLPPYAGLSAGPHTMVIQVLGTKNAAATSTKVVVDGFVVHA